MLPIVHSLHEDEYFHSGMFAACTYESFILIICLIFMVVNAQPFCVR